MTVFTVEESRSPISSRGRGLQSLSTNDNNPAAVTSTPDNNLRFSTESSVHGLIELQAKVKPDAIAIAFEVEHSMTYYELNGLANAVARQLVCGRGAIVPIAVSRSINMIVALLAVLKSGAAYTLLSTDSPKDRNQFIVDDTKAPFVIVDKAMYGTFDGTRQVQIEELVAKAEMLSKTHYSNLDVYQAPTDYAYVIYTSGTTGRPKGVLLSHAAAYAGLCASPALDPVQSFRQLLCHSPNFSAAQRTILGTLSRGGTLCLASKDNITLHLHDIIEQMGISTLEITPSMLKLMEPSMVPQTVKRITLGGEPVGPALVESWADKVELISAYGLSECTQLNFRHSLKPGSDPRMIGKPSDSTTYHVLEPNSLALVAAGVAGELCLSGAQLAHGYLNLPEVTNAVFVQNAFGPGRLYRSGDLVVSNRDGLIELVGRIDQQIKIDGQRVEPNESNSIIQLQPGVAMSYVVSAFVLNRKSLVAVVVPESSRDWPTLVSGLRSTLRSVLPSYSTPRYWVQQEQLPLNTNGKIDIAALVSTVEAMNSSQLITPSTSLLFLGSSQPSINDMFEYQIVEVAAEVLSLGPEFVDLNASFQELGGTSLDAILFASKLRKKSIRILVPDILQANSLRGLVLHGTHSPSAATTLPVPFSLLRKNSALDMAGLEDAYPVTPLQESVLADSILENANHVYHRVYKLQGASPAQVQAAIETIIAKNSILRTTFRPFKRSFVQIVNKYVPLSWKLVRGKSLSKFLEESKQQGMAIDEPLIRGTVLNEELLVLEMHHALFDFWSSQFVLADAIAVLEGKTPTSRLPFSTYVAYQQSAHDELAKDFWKSYLGQAPPTILDIPKAAESEEPFVLEADIGGSLSELTDSHGVTMGTALHAAWALTLARLLKSTDVTFMTAFSGRDAEIDGALTLNGPTLCTVPMRVQVDTSVSIIEFAKGVQHNLWELSRYAHSGTRDALAAGSLKAGSFNSMVNLLVKLQETPEDAPLKPLITHSDNFTQ